MKILMQKKKILFLITKGAPFGGAQKYVYDLATNAPQGVEVIVACGEGDGLPNALTEKGIRVIKIPRLFREVSFFDEFKVCSDLIKLIRAEQPDIVHLNSSKIGGIGAVAARIVSIFTKNYSNKVIFTAHGWAFNEDHRSILARTFYTLSHWITLLLAHQTIAVSEGTKRGVMWMPFVKNKVRVIHNGIANFKMRTKKEARVILGGEETKKTIIFSIAELHPNKGLDIALNAIARLPQELAGKTLYCIAGTGEERERLEGLAQGLEIQDKVRLLGFVPNAKDLLSGADLFLLPSRNENLPGVLLEAGLAGIPVIATSVGGIPEIVSDMQNGILVHPRNPREIAEAIQYFIENPDRVKIFKEKMKQKVRDNFSLDQMVEKTYSLYFEPAT